MTTDVHGLSGAYVLDAVDDIERAAFTRHLAECEMCATEVAELREAAGALGDFADEPPPGLRARVLAEIGRTPQAAPPFEPRVDPPRVNRSEQRWRRATLATIAAALVAIAGTWFAMDMRLSDEQVKVQALQSERERIYAVMNANDVLMLGTDLRGGGRMAAAVSNSQRAGVAMLAGLPNPPAGDTYQMWLITAGKATSALVLDTGVIGGTMLFDWAPGVGTSFGITVEPAGGSDSPTMAPLGTIPLT